MGRSEKDEEITMNDDTRIERDDEAPADAGDDEVEGVEVPFEQLSAQAQRGVLVEYVTREGTDYGEREVSLDVKLEQVRRQIEVGDVVLRFDPRSSTVNLVAVARRGRRSTD